MPDLAVELDGERIGLLSGTSRDFDFTFDQAALARHGAGSPVLSVGMLTALPMKPGQRDRRQNFFHELLPEGRNLARLARMAGVSEGDSMALLARYGKDVAGALQIWDINDPKEPLKPALEPVATAAVAHMLTHPEQTPLGNVPHGGKTSLTGVQDKLVLTLVGETWHRPLNGWPSTHILKSVDPERPASTIWDEEYGARLAVAVGLARHHTWVGDFAGVPALIVERYDRLEGRRIHQEDVSQALGLRGDQKYQRYGGRVTLDRIAALVREFCAPTDLTALARRTVFAAAIGDLDMHAKNLSLLHPHAHAVSLAPAYDVVPQAHQPNDGEMALAVDGIYAHALITVDHLANELERWGLRGARALVTETLEQVRSAVATAEPLPHAHPGLRDDIAAFVHRLLNGEPVGRPHAVPRP